MCLQGVKLTDYTEKRLSQQKVVSVRLRGNSLCFIQHYSQKTCLQYVHKPRCVHKPSIIYKFRALQASQHIFKIKMDLSYQLKEASI